MPHPASYVKHPARRPEINKLPIYVNGARAVSTEDVVLLTRKSRKATSSAWWTLWGTQRQQ